MVLLHILCFLFVLNQIHSIAAAEEVKHDAKRPNIVFILAEDLGWDDIAIHGSRQIITPTMDDFARSGVLLNSYYTSPSPFATRCEIMTGKYASKLGVQHGVFHNKQRNGLPEGEKILPEYLQELGYSTHAVGKWGLGFYKESMLPWKRGFDTFYGGLTSSTVDYFTHSGYDENYGLDLRQNEEVVHNETGKYATELYTDQAVKIIEEYDDTRPFFLYVSHQAVHSGNLDDPLQVPDRYLEKVRHVKDAKRRKFAGMVNALDESILNISIALSDHGFMSNTVIIFTSLSGGAVGGMELSMGSNYPLRGSKMTVWEGGIRTVAIVVSDLISDTSFVNEELFHSTDWLPTIINLATAGEDLPINGLDGFNVWESMTHLKTISPRFEILHQFDTIQNNQCALRVGDYKIIVNQDIGYYGDWFPRPAEIDELRNLSSPTDTMKHAKLTCDKNYPHPFLEMHAPPCDPIKKPCLFNIQWDPCEFHNLANFMPNTLKVLKDRLSYYHGIVKAPVYPELDPTADPENNNGVWGPWIGVIASTMPSNFSEEEQQVLGILSDVNNITLPTKQPNYPVQSNEYPGAIVPATNPPSTEKMSGLVEMQNETMATPATILLQTNQTITYPNEIYTNASSVLGQDINFVTTTQSPLETTTETTTTVKNTTDNIETVGTGNNTNGPSIMIAGSNVKMSKAKEGAFGAESNTSDTMGSTSETMTTKTNALGVKISEKDVGMLTLDHSGTSLETNNSIEALSTGNRGDWAKGLEMATSTTHEKNNFVISGSFKGETTNQTAPEFPKVIGGKQTIGVGSESNEGPGQFNNSTDGTLTSVSNASNASVSPKSNTSEVSPLPEQHVEATQREHEQNKTEFVGTENGSETTSESEAGGMSRIDSNSTSIKEPYYNAQLNTIADAGSNGPKSMNSSSTMTSGGKINPNRIPTASEFIPEPKYTKIEKPMLNKPVNGVINPFKVNDTSFDSSLGAGAEAGAGAGSKSETVVGNLADTLASIDPKEKPSNKGPKKTSGTKDKNLNSIKSLYLAGEEVKSPAESSKIASMYPQQLGTTNNTNNRGGGDGEGPVQIFVTDNNNSGTSTSTDAGSTSESKIGNFGEAGSSTLTNSTSNGSTNKTVNTTSPAITSNQRENANKKLSGSIKNFAHIPGEKGSGITLVSPGEVNQRVFQSVSDVVSDSSAQLCPDGRDCINKIKSEEKPESHGNETVQGKTEATSNETYGANDNTNKKPEDENTSSTTDNQFNGTVWFHHKKFAIVGTANEIDVNVDDASPVKNSNIPKQPKPSYAPIQKKQNIGFNVMLPATIIKQLTAPKLKDELRLKSLTKTQKDTVEQVSVVRHSRPKAAIRKVLDMITDPERTRKTQVPRVSDILSSAIHEPDSLDMTMSSQGDLGDSAFAVKPILRDNVETPAEKATKNKTTEVESLTKESTNLITSPSGSEPSGDLGTIVTLVGKSKSSDNSNRIKHNETSNIVGNEEITAHKKTMETSERLASKHTQQNASSSSETNAANINQISGPSNSIIVSSVIVVLIAAFVVVGMAVVAVVAVVARHCNLGKHLQTGS